MATWATTENMVRAAALLLLVTCLAMPATLAASTELFSPEEGPEGRALHQWDPSQSWPGGAQRDPRLDQPVKFWRAGLALREVFASVEEQTGIKLGFWPEGGENPRVRVNLYLNPDQSPTLRDLMAQLTWVTDCGFANTEAAPDEPGPTYYLLRTSIGGTPRDLGVVEERARQRVSRPAQPFAVADARAEVRANLEELRRALALPREELIARYKGVDDYLLLTLTDPRRRAAAEYICAAISEEDALPESDTWSERSWDQLTADEHRLLSAAWRLISDALRDSMDQGELVPAVRLTPWDQGLGAALRLEAFVRPRSGAARGPMVSLVDPAASCVAPTRGTALLELERLSPEAVASFLRDIGETIPEGREHTRVDEWKAALSQQRRREELKALASAAPLSPTTAANLASLELPLEGGHSYALWELQEAVAAASGLHVVSDCFWQPARPLHDTDSALSALASASHAWARRAQELYEPAWLAGWEWGGAGSFLRFRSIDRDVWRAALLPDETVAQLDAYLTSFLPQSAEADWPPDGFSLWLRPDALQLVRIVGRLEDLQLAYGGWLVYGDPSDPTAASLDALREAFLALVTRTQDDPVRAARELNAFRIMVSLNEEQWELARGRGLPGTEMTKDQVALLPKALDPGTWASYKDRLSLTLLKAGDYMGPAWDRAKQPLWFYLALVDPEALQGTLPDGYSMDLRLFEWRCRPRIEVHVPRPLRPAALLASDQHPSPLVPIPNH